jgi:hypothetical protein
MLSYLQDRMLSWFFSCRYFEAFVRDMMSTLYSGRESVLPSLSLAYKCLIQLCHSSLMKIISMMVGGVRVDLCA